MFLVFKIQSWSMIHNHAYFQGNFLESIFKSSSYIFSNHILQYFHVQISQFQITNTFKPCTLHITSQYLNHKSLHFQIIFQLHSHYFQFQSSFQYITTIQHEQNSEQANAMIRRTPSQVSACKLVEHTKLEAFTKRTTLHHFVTRAKFNLQIRWKSESKPNQRKNRMETES